MRETWPEELASVVKSVAPALLAVIDTVPTRRPPAPPDPSEIGEFVQALGVPKAWLYREDFAGVPVMVSRTEFVRKRKGETNLEAHARPLRRPGRKARPWREVLARYVAQDSSAFVIVDKFGGWPFEDPQWADDVDYICEETGTVPEHIAIRDLMCEPDMLRKLGTTVRQNQEHTLRSYLELCRLRPGRPWLPTLQGWEPEDYERHADMYEAHGVSLARAALVGVGSVCKRRGKALRAAPHIFRRLKARGIRCHAFGFDIRGTEALVSEGLLSFDGGPGVCSGDSQGAFAGARRRYRARLTERVDPSEYLIPGHDLPGPGRRTGHTNCGCGCPQWGLRWRDKHVARIVEARGRYARRRTLAPTYQRGEQMALALGGAA